ncbi:fungal-specific transcription factor domain-containing protein [Crassisporium funariophilum]|nr:fungal-specific transcription factor domain-containing protein [Crassisporium funariophilum]
MPATPKSPRPKKSSSIAKPKGAVRAKSGCYTCRIRRKKCDEKRTSEEGACETCHRLKLECLGFGAKRPDWLRESTRVSLIRDKIKAHLAAQGMIKGHSGSGSRNAVQEEILRLSEIHESQSPFLSGGSSTSNSPHPRDFSEESDRSPYHPNLSFHPVPSNIRDIQTQYAHDVDLRSSRCDSPFDNLMDHTSHDDYELQVQPYSVGRESPATRSSFSGLYNIPDSEWYDESDYINEYTQGQLRLPAVWPTLIITGEVRNESIKSYVEHIVKIQYLLGDQKTLPAMIWNSVKSHEASHEAVSLLSHTYYKRRTHPDQPVLNDSSVNKRIGSLRSWLTPRANIRSADDAMTALHLVSLFLFDGGQGPWAVFLEFAATYVVSVLENPDYHRSYPLALESCDPKDRFIVKTTIWFDVLASITTQKQPRLIGAIRELFGPNQSNIGGMSPSYSMMTPMGCENIVLWALAEASSLSVWKRNQQNRGTLSIRDLVQKAYDIESYLVPQYPQPPPPLKDPIELSRFLASQIFRSSTKLFLHTIINGDYPHVHDIKMAVQETYRCIKSFPDPVADLKSAIVRSTVFGIYICGSLTDDKAIRRGLILHLQQNSGDDAVGNCSTIRRLLEELWEARGVNSSPSIHVEWRQHLQRNQVLLV